MDHTEAETFRKLKKIPYSELIADYHIAMDKFRHVPLGELKIFNPIDIMSFLRERGWVLTEFVKSYGEVAAA